MGSFHGHRRRHGHRRFQPAHDLARDRGRHMTTPPASSWLLYFPFEKGVSFEVKGPFGYDGSGSVVTRNAEVLAFSLQMPGKRVLTKKLPAIDLTIQLKYVGEGSGNSADGKLTRDGGSPESFKDRNVTIDSDP